MLFFAVACGASSTSSGLVQQGTEHSSETQAYARWDTQEPVETEGLTTRIYYVTRNTSVCPTREGAQVRSCGNSVEFSAEGLALVVGTEVTVVGDAPLDGQWRALRPSINGALPSWIRADDVSAEANLSEQRAYLASEAFTSAQPIDTMSAEAVAGLPSGTLVRFTARRDICLAAIAQAEELENSAVVYVAADDSFIAVGLLEASPDNGGPEEWPWAQHHGCFDDNDLELAYCSGDQEVSILAFVTPHQVSTPTDEDFDGNRLWSGPETQMPFLVGINLVDRTGVHAFRVPAAMESYQPDN